MRLVDINPCFVGRDKELGYQRSRRCMELELHCLGVVMIEL